MRHWLASAIIAATILAAFGRLVASPLGIIHGCSAESIRENDLLRLYMPMHWRIAERIHANGRIPGWDPSGFGGRPLIGNPQAGLWYPPVWLFWWLRTPSILGWITVAHLVFAGIGAYLLARRCGVGSIAAIAAGLVFALNPYAIAHVTAGHCPHLWAAAWYPWAFLAALAWRNGSRRGLLGLSAALAASLCAGHPQVGFLLAVTLGFWALFELAASAAHGNHIARRRFSLGVLSACAGTVALTAIEWAPVAAAQPWTLHSGRVALHDADRYVLPLNSVLTSLVSPAIRLGSRAEATACEHTAPLCSTIGIAALLGCAIAFRSRGQRAWIWLLVAALVIAAGRSCGLYTLLYHAVPGFDRFRAQSRTLFLAALAIALLTAFGIEVAQRRRWIGCALAALIALDLIAGSWQRIVVTPVDRFGSVANALAARPSKPGQRVRYADGSITEWSAAIAGLESTDLYDWFQIKHAADLYESLYGLDTYVRPADLIDPLGTWHRSIVRQGVLDRMSVGAVLGTGVTTHNASALPRAYVVGNVQVAPHDSRALEWLAWTNPREHVVMPLDPLAGMTPDTRQAFAPAHYQSTSDPDRVRVDVTTAAPGILVVADTWMPGWSATLDGQPVELLCANRAQRAVVLPKPGRHRIEMRYDPPGLLLGAIVSAASWACWLTAFAALSFQKRNARSQTHPWRLRSHHSAVSKAVKISRNGQLSQSLSSLRVT